MPAPSPDSPAGRTGSTDPALLVEQLDLRADCSRCTGLCCVALTLTRSADFAIDKPAGDPCPHLAQDFGCGIHSRLRERGFPGCTAYDCLGAGQRVTAAVRSAHDGATWRDDATAAREAFAALPVVSQLHELLWYLAEVLARPEAGPVHAEARTALAATEALASGTPAELAALDVGAHRRTVGPVVDRASALVRAAARAASGAPEAAPAGQAASGAPAPPRRSRLRPGADLVGARLAGTDLTGADLRGALLLGADLRAADLTAVDLLGADLRGAELGGADLSGALFVVPGQLGAARGDAATRLPAALERPGHWAGRRGPAPQGRMDGWRPRSSGTPAR